MRVCAIAFEAAHARTLAQAVARQARRSTQATRSTPRQPISTVTAIADTDHNRATAARQRVVPCLGLSTTVAARVQHSPVEPCTAQRNPNSHRTPRGPRQRETYTRQRARARPQPRSVATRLLPCPDCADRPHQTTRSNSSVAALHAYLPSNPTPTTTLTTTLALTRANLPACSCSSQSLTVVCNTVVQRCTVTATNLVNSHEHAWLVARRTEKNPSSLAPSTYNTSLTLLHDTEFALRSRREIRALVADLVEYLATPRLSRGPYTELLSLRIAAEFHTTRWTDFVYSGSRKRIHYK